MYFRWSTLILIILLSNSSLFALAETTKQQQTNLSYVTDVKNLKSWQDYLKNHIPIREEDNYISLQHITPDRVIVVPLEPNFALKVQELLFPDEIYHYKSDLNSEKILLITYSFKYGGPLWWGSLWRWGRPEDPPDEFSLEIKLKVYLLNTETGSLVGYPEQSYNTNTDRRDEKLKELFSKMKNSLPNASIVLNITIEKAYKKINRVGRVIDEDEDNIHEELYRKIAKIEIKEGDAQLRQRGAEILIKNLKQSDVGILTNLLQDKDSYVRGAVIEKLIYSSTRDILGSGIIPLYRRALLDNNSYIRKKTVEGLGKVKSPEAFEMLLIAAKDEEDNVRREAAGSLGEIGNRKGIEVLIPLLDDNDLSVYRTAADSLKKIGWKPKDITMQVKYLLAAKKTDDLVVLGKQVVPLLIQELQRKVIRKAANVAVNALGKIGDQQSIRPLMLLLVHENKSLRKDAANALGEMGDTQAVIPLIACLKDNDNYTPPAAAKALGKIGDVRAVIPLIAYVRASESKKSKIEAIEALANIGDKRAIKLFLNLLIDRQEDIRKAAAGALKKFKWQPKNSDEKVRVFFANGDIDSIVKLGKIAVKSLLPMLASNSVELRVEVIRILERLGSNANDAVVAISASLKSENETESTAAASALAGIGSNEASESIRKALEFRNKPDRVSLWMRYALAQLDVQRDEHIKEILDAVGYEFGDTAVKVISKINLNNEEIEIVQNLLINQNPSIRKRAAEILGHSGGSPVVNILWKRLAEENEEEIRRVIREAIKNASR